jgi:predicted Mrr-cat superfamily restriction endonuclease
MIGWSQAEGLLDDSVSWEAFRAIVHNAYYATEGSLRKAGAAGGHIWRFVRAMKAGDLVVVPSWAEFYVAKITGPATYDPAKIDEDTAYRRAVVWLNDKKPIPRPLAKAALISRMKIQGTSADASDLLTEIKECLDLAEKGKNPTFQTDLQAKLVAAVMQEMQSGRIEDFGFERLIQVVLTGLGAKEVRIVPQIQDKGADLLRHFWFQAHFSRSSPFRQNTGNLTRPWAPMWSNN